MAIWLYEFRVKGHLGDGSAKLFDGFKFECIMDGEEGNAQTILTGPVKDQSALFGILFRIRDLGLDLVSVNQVEPK